MNVTRFERGIRIEVDLNEAEDLAEFLGQFYEGTDEAPDILSARLDDVLERQNKYDAGA